MDRSRREWISAHIFYHDNLDDLLIGAVRPLIERLRSRDMIALAFFIRYWQAGPHVRLRLLPNASIDEAAIRSALDEAIGGFLRSHPSRTLIREAAYLRAALPLSQVEPGREPIDPLQPNNSVRFYPYEPEYARYGGTAESIEIVEEHFAESSALALDVIATGGSRERRVGHALAMMFVCASVACDGDLVRARRFFQTGRGDWGRRLTLGQLDRQEARFEERFQRQRPRLLDLVGRLHARVRGEATETADWPVSRWMGSVRGLKDRLQSLERNGRFNPQDVVIAGGHDQDEDRTGLTSVLLLCSHLNSNRLGISLPEEAYLGYLIGRTVDEIVAGSEVRAADAATTHGEGRP